jgi:hypothetical protein
MDTSHYLSHKELRQRGWTRPLLEELLPEPDLAEWDPIEKVTIKLYERRKVERLECSRRVYALAGALRAQREEQRRAAQAARSEGALVTSGAEEVSAWLAGESPAKLAQKEAPREPAAEKVFGESIEELLQDLDFAIPLLKREVLIERAIKHHNNRQRNERSPWLVYAGEVSAPVLHRLVVNYLRHRATDYEEKLQALRHLAPLGGYTELKRKVLVAIGQAYPWLVDACEEQLAQLGRPERRRAA